MKWLKSYLALCGAVLLLGLLTACGGSSGSGQRLNRS